MGRVRVRRKCRVQKRGRERRRVIGRINAGWFNSVMQVRVIDPEDYVRWDLKSEL